MVVERELTGWELAEPLFDRPITSICLVTSETSPRPGFKYTLCFPLSNAIRVLLVGPERPPHPHSNVVLEAAPQRFTARQTGPCEVAIAFPTNSEADSDLDGSKRRREARLSWSDSVLLQVWEELDGSWVRLCADLPARSYALTEHGIMRHWLIERDNVHFGLGEKAAPLDLTGRSFSISGTDAACYDAFLGDPLYKHTPFLISAPRPKPGKPTPSTYALYHASNSNGLWDLGRHHDDPWGYFKTYTQDHGGLDEWYLFGAGPKQVTRTWAEIVGMPLLVGRDWLGYLASGMGLGESVSFAMLGPADSKDDPPAQDLLARWPELCREHGIPCSAIHVGVVMGGGADAVLFRLHCWRGWESVRVHDEHASVPRLSRACGRPAQGGHQGGAECKAMFVKSWGEEADEKDVLETHPSFKRLHESNALFYDPFVKKPVVTRIWSSGVGVNGRGSWVDMTSEDGRRWWAEGVRGLLDLGVDGMWK